MLELNSFKFHDSLHVVVQGCVGITWAPLPASSQTGSSASWTWTHHWKANFNFSLRRVKQKFPVPF